MKTALCKKLIIVLIAALLATMLYGCNRSDEKTIADNVSISGIDVSKLTYAEAEAKVIAKLHADEENVQYTVLIGDKTETVSNKELGVSARVDEAVKNALEADDGASIALMYEADENAVAEYAAMLAKKYNTDGSGAKAKYIGNGKFTFTDATCGTVINENSLTRDIMKAVQDGRQKAIANIDEVAYSGEKTLNKVKKSCELIAQYTTSFAKSPLCAENRVKNINKAAELVDGTVVRAGDNFDTNAILGDRNKENGWFTATGIRNGKYSREYGGGVCQVSSTLYNAVLLANLEVVDRSPHSWPMSYVPVGQDATISTDGPNFVFCNSSECAITIAATVDMSSKTLTVQVFGEKPNEYADVKIITEETGTIPAPEPEYIQDSGIEPGVQLVDRKARNGKKAVTIRIFLDENGNEISRETVCENTYRAIGARILINDS